MHLKYIFNDFIIFLKVYLATKVKCIRINLMHLSNFTDINVSFLYLENAET